MPTLHVLQLVVLQLLICLSIFGNNLIADCSASLQVSGALHEESVLC